MSLKSLRIAGIAGIATTAASLLAAVSPSADTKQATPASKLAAKAAAKPATAPNGAKIEAIKKMLATSGTVEGNVEGARESIKAMTKNSPNINPKFWDELDQKVNRAAFEQMLVEVYDRNYTLDEINGLTKFYASPAGKAFLEKNGKVLSESGRTLQAYMEGNSKELMKKHGQPAPKAEPK